jgi:hypothetical protein
MEGLRRITSANSGAAHSVNDAIFEMAKDLLRHQGLIVFEEVIIRAKQRKDRNLIQWDVQRVALKEYYGRHLVPLSRATLREMIESKIDRLRVLKDVEELLTRGGPGGGRTAGYAFPERYQSITERQIAARRHQADGMNNNADAVEAQLRNPPLPIKDQTDDEDS